MSDVIAVESGADYFVTNTGSPHYIKWVDDIENFEVFNEGKAIRYNERFSKEGINVNFVQHQKDHLFVRTYERGVENETLSCGTGATAAALASSEKMGPQLTNVEVEGGALQIAFDRVGEQEFNNIWLIGPAQFVYSGKIEI